jgi:hypothetical protein
MTPSAVLSDEDFFAVAYQIQPWTGTEIYHVRYTYPNLPLLSFYQAVWPLGSFTDVVQQFRTAN